MINRQYTHADDPVLRGERDDAYEDWLIAQTGPDDYTDPETRARELHTAQTNPATVPAGAHTMTLDPVAGRIAYVWRRYPHQVSVRLLGTGQWEASVGGHGGAWSRHDAPQDAFAAAATMIDGILAPAPATVDPAPTSPTRDRDAFAAVMADPDAGPVAVAFATVMAAVEAEDAGLTSGRLVHCPNCGEIVAANALMHASLGIACPRCYDDLSG